MPATYQRDTFLTGDHTSALPLTCLPSTFLPAKFYTPIPTIALYHLLTLPAYHLQLPLPSPSTTIFPTTYFQHVPIFVSSFLPTPTKKKSTNYTCY